MKDISKLIVQKIKEGHIIPESKFKLQWKSYLFWTLIVAMVIIGALSLSLTILNLSDIDPRFLRHMELGKLIMILTITAPYLWIILFFSALYFGIKAFRSTYKGYRHSTLFVTSIVVLSISILGFFSHFLDIDNRMHGVFSRNVPNFKGLVAPREGRWLRPGDGLIGGEVIKKEVDTLYLKSFDDNEWLITYNEKTEGNNLAEIAVGKKVGIVGEKNGEFSMQARMIRIFPDDWNGQPPRKPDFPDRRNKMHENFPMPDGLGFPEDIQL